MAGGFLRTWTRVMSSLSRVSLKSKIPIFVDGTANTIEDSEESTLAFTPATTRSPSPIPTSRPVHDSNEHVRTSSNSKRSEFEISYRATLRTGNESVTVKLDPTGVKGPQSDILTNSKEMWEWMIERGFNVSLGDVVELAKKMASKKDESSC